MKLSKKKLVEVDTMLTAIKERTLESSDIIDAFDEYRQENCTLETAEPGKEYMRLYVTWTEVLLEIYLSDNATLGDLKRHLQEIAKKLPAGYKRQKMFVPSWAPKQVRYEYKCDQDVGLGAWVSFYMPNRVCKVVETRIRSVEEVVYDCGSFFSNDNVEETTHD